MLPTFIIVECEKEDAFLGWGGLVKKEPTKKYPSAPRSLPHSPRPHRKKLTDYFRLSVRHFFPLRFFQFLMQFNFERYFLFGFRSKLLTFFAKLSTFMFFMLMSFPLYPRSVLRPPFVFQPPLPPPPLSRVQTVSFYLLSSVSFRNFLFLFSTFLV